MKKLMCVALVLGSSLFSAGNALAGTAIVHAGVNPFPDFPATGGTATFGNDGANGQVLKEFTSLGDVPIIINTGPATGQGESFHINERVTNHSGIDWTDFHLIVQKIDAGPSLGVAFQNVTNSTGEFGSIVPGPGSLSLFGSVPNGHTFSLSFDLQITDQQGAFGLFGIHEFPTVPEPSSLALLAVGSLGLLGCAIRRRRVRA